MNFHLAGWKGWTWEGLHSNTKEQDSDNEFENDQADGGNAER